MFYVVLVQSLTIKSSGKKRRGFFSGGYDDALCLVDSKYVGKLYRYLLTIFIKG